MVHGVARLTLRVVPPVLKKYEVKNKGKLEAVRHKVKAARLIGDEICKDLLYIFIYYTKPTYLLSNACQKIK